MTWPGPPPSSLCRSAVRMDHRAVQPRHHVRQRQGRQHGRPVLEAVQRGEIRS